MSAAVPVRIDLRQEPGAAVLSLAGSLDVATTAAARRDVARRLDGSPPGALEVDASGLTRADMSGMSLLYELAQGRLVPGVRATVRGLRPEFATLLAAFPPTADLDG
ncbi:MAG TPA: STAS domain-containing protein, partial [Thermoanaerobaculia bacterium]